MKNSKKVLIITLVILWLGLIGSNFLIFFSNQDLEENTFQKPVLAATPVFRLDWNRTWGGINDDYGRAIAMDALNNIYIAGSSNSTGAEEPDVSLIKYNSEGIQQWNRTWGYENNDACYDIAIDNANNIFLVGITEINGPGFQDICLIKFDEDGNQLWNETWYGSDTDRGYAIKLDTSNNVYITGLASGDVVLIKYNNLGIQQWNRTWGGANWDEGHSLALDSESNIYITGYTSSYGAGMQDICFIKYNNSGDLQWNYTWGGSSPDYGYGMEIDTSNNIYITGRTDSFGSGTSDVVLIKYNTSGNQIWNTTWGGSNPEVGDDIAFDLSEDIFISGYTTSCFCVLKYNSSGGLEWSYTNSITQLIQMNSSSIFPFDTQHEGNSIVIDDHNNMYIGGLIGGMSTLFEIKDFDHFLVKLMIDADGDGLGDWEEQNIYFTDPSDSDMDDDLLSDKEECLPGKDGYITDPNDPDTDDDDIPDWYESLYFIIMDPTNSSDRDLDPDNDLLTNYSEFLNGTNCNDSDTDGDTLSDGNEVFGNSNQYDSLPTDPNLSDTDGDGLNDSAECTGSGNPYDNLPTNPNDPDTDDDGLLDNKEIIYSTNPNDPDTDGDGYNDGYEVANGFNPKDAWSNPITMMTIIVITLISSSIIAFGFFRLLKAKKKKRKENEKVNQGFIKKIVLEMSTEHTRIELSDISNKSKVKNKDLIESTLIEMINNNEVYGQYFKATQSIAFDQQANMREIDKLMNLFSEWEGKKE